MTINRCMIVPTGYCLYRQGCCRGERHQCMRHCRQRKHPRSIIFAS